jgi:hypothetical protein
MTAAAPEDGEVTPEMNEADQRLVREIEEILGRWDGDGDETYLELAERLIRRIRIDDKKGVPEKRI